MKTFILGAVAAVLATSAAHAQITQTSYTGLSGTQLVTFDDIAGGSGNGGAGTNYDSNFVSNGVGFGERFVGQTLTANGNFDVLGGAPTGGTLTLQAGAANQNLNVFTYNATNVLTGLGPLGYPSSDAIGEGSFAALFSSDQSQFGFQLVGGDAGTATVNFYRANGSLIQQIVLSGLADSYYGFSRDGGVKDIRGISIFNNDAGGIGFDNLKFDVPSTIGVPEPASWAMMLVGVGAMGGVLRRRRTVATRVRFA